MLEVHCWTQYGFVFRKFNCWSMMLKKYYIQNVKERHAAQCLETTCQCDNADRSENKSPSNFKDCEGMQNEYDWLTEWHVGVKLTAIHGQLATSMDTVKKPSGVGGLVESFCFHNLLLYASAATSQEGQSYTVSNPTFGLLQPCSHATNHTSLQTSFFSPFLPPHLPPSIHMPLRHPVCQCYWKSITTAVHS